MSKAKPARLRAISRVKAAARRKRVTPETAARPSQADGTWIAQPLNIATQPDLINHPAHYNRGGIECMDVSAAMVTGWTPQAAYRLGQAHDYLFRHAHKGAPIQDLEKAVFWIQEHIRALKAEAPRGDAA